jgi:alcohol dehydrogenase class IV
LHFRKASASPIDHALAFNAEVAADRFRRMAQTIGLTDPSAKSFLAWLTDLKRRVGVPARLRDAGIKEEQLPKLVEVATADACHPNNPKPVTKADFEAIFKAAY